MEMRECKECGKLFVPKGRERYCSNDHYRPCPICGEPVIAKYLSDPPRKCDNCKGKRAHTNKLHIPSASTSSSDLFTSMSLGDKFDIPTSEEIQAFAEPSDLQGHYFCKDRLVKYRGRTSLGKFEPEHIYKVSIEWNGFSYSVSSSEDITIGEDSSAYLTISSRNSLARYFSQHIM